VRLPSQIIGKAIWPFQSRGRAPLLFEEKKNRKGSSDPREKETEGEDFSLKVFHAKIMIYGTCTLCLLSDK
jgi:hypothetical protein